MKRKYSIIVEGYYPGRIAPCAHEATRYFSTERAAKKAADKLIKNFIRRELDYTTRTQWISA